jgi:glycosyltransferase involved in cell wall biosynthesis
MSVKYSICTTCYRSVNLVESFMSPLLSLGKDYEVVVVDNYSDDGTFEKLRTYGPNVIGIKRKCTRGKGRQTAMDNSHGEVSIHVEFEVEYSGISSAVDFYEKSNQDKIYYFIIEGQKCNASLYIGQKELFLKVGGFPDLNYAEDLYFNKKATKVNLLEVVSICMPIECLEIKGMSSGMEARYEKGIYHQIKRRIIATRDILFVNRIGYKELMEKYKLKGYKALFVGLPEYLMGKLLRFTINLPDPDD